MTTLALATLPVLLAQEATEARGYTISVGLVLLCVILGLVVALTPVKRETEFRRVKDQ